MDRQPTASSVLKNQAQQKRGYAAHMRAMAQRQRDTAVEFDAMADSFEKSAKAMERIAREENHEQSTS